MALRKTVTEIVEAVRGECKLSSNTSRGVDHREHIVQLIKSHYEQLCEDYDWEHLQVKRDSNVSRKALAAGQRYYDFPAALNQQKIERAWVRWNETWLPLEFGISFEDYSALDSDDTTGTRVDPPLRWDYYHHDQFQIWPTPATNGTAAGYAIAFEGQRTPEQLTGNESRADLDHLLIALFVSAEILAENEREAASQIKLQRAARRLAVVRAGMSSKARVRIGLGTTRSFQRRPRTIDFVR